MRSRYFGKKLDDAVKSLFVGHRDLRERVRAAVGDVRVVFGDPHDQTPSEGLWKEIHDLISPLDRQRIDEMDETELLEVSYKLVRAAMEWEREDAVYDYQVANGENP